MRVPVLWALAAVLAASAIAPAVADSPLPRPRPDIAQTSTIESNAPQPPVRPDLRGAVGSLDPAEPQEDEEKAAPAVPASPEELSGVTPKLQMPERPEGAAVPADTCAKQLRVIARAAPLDAIVGEDGCHIAAPYDVVSIGAAPPVSLVPAGTLACPMIEALAAWTDGPVQNAAQDYLGQAVAGYWVAASYVCRTRNGEADAKLSEHAYGNAIDISAFVLEDGGVVDVRLHWDGDTAKSTFLHRAHAAACAQFSTVLGPESDDYHKTHFHLDLAARKNDYKVCE
ncbi:MAG: extensin family protein [Hyphomicrobiales bacterium]|nr:extensin family protein [Hyphomicrobiales bacterium]